MRDSALIADCVSVERGSTTVLSNVSLAVDYGEFKGISGSSGSGKTTLLQCLSGLIPIHRGSVRLLDMEIRPSVKRRVIRDVNRLYEARVGFVFQDALLVEDISVEDNLAYAMVSAKRPVDQSDISSVLTSLGIDDVSNQRPGTLSGGQRQRVALARTLVKDPEIIFADEPTGALDGPNAEVVFRALSGFSGAGGSVVMVSHDRSLLDRCDDVFDLDGVHS